MPRRTAMRKIVLFALLFCWLACEDTTGPARDRRYTGTYDLVPAQVIGSTAERDSLVSGVLTLNGTFTSEILWHRITAGTVLPIDTAVHTGSNYSYGVGCGGSGTGGPAIWASFRGDTLVTKSRSMFDDAELRWVKRAPVS